MFFGRLLNRDEIARLKKEREESDQQYNAALTALDLAIPRVSSIPHPPLVYDEHQITPLNERWSIVAAPPSFDHLKGWRRRLAAFVWQLVEPIFQRQEQFNGILVDHLNRNVQVHRATRESIESTLALLRGQFGELEAFHGTLIRYAQTITLYVDTKDRSETLALIIQGLVGGLDALTHEYLKRADEIQRLLDGVSDGLDGVSDEFLKRWESMVAREQRYVSAVDELRTTIGGVQQTGMTLKRELGRLLSASRGPVAPGAGIAVASPDPASTHAAVSVGEARVLDDHKYVGFENKFRGSERDIRERLAGYLPLFEGARDVLDVGCGRGEFLVLLGEHGIGASGLDLNHEMVELCRQRGVAVAEGDALAYLEALPDGSLGGIFAAQVAEHFQPGYLMRFLDCAYHKMRPGSRIVLETLNPACWSAFFDSYIRDVTHVWPLHPETLKYLVMASGFQRIELRYLSPYPREARLQRLSTARDADLPLASQQVVDTINDNVDRLNNLMFSDRDYAVVGERL